MGSIFSLLGMLATGNFRRLFTVLLGLALVGGLWETSLVNLSSRSTATAIMTEVGVDLINPVLVGHSFGVSQTVYTSLQQTAKAHPTQALSVPGIKVQLLGSEIAGKSLSETLRVIYAKVAVAYYDGGAAGVFAVPEQVSQALGALSVLPQAVASQGAKAVGAPQLPQVPLPPLGAVGLSPQLFTADGHNQALTLDKWLLGAALLFALLLALIGKRWQRLTSVCWSLISGALPGVLVIGIIAAFRLQNPAPFQPFNGLLNLIGGAVVPVYGGAMAAGVGGLIVALVGDLVLKSLSHGQAMPSRAGAPAGQRGGWEPVGAGYGQPEYRRPPLPGPSYTPQQPYPLRGYAPAAGPEPPRPYPPNVDTYPWQPSPSSGDRWPQTPASDNQWPPAQGWDAPSGGGAPRRSPQPFSQPGYGQPGYGQPGYGQGGYGEQAWPDPNQPQERPPYRGSGPMSRPGGPQSGGDDTDGWPPRRGY